MHLIEPQLILFIILINVTFVSLNTIRVILIMRGLRLPAACLSMLEVFIYLTGLTTILLHLDNIYTIAAYCLGFGCGVFLGSYIEERVALGYVMGQVVISQSQMPMVEVLRKNSFGVTLWLAEGRDDHRLMLQILTKRRRQRELTRLIRSECPNAFIVFQDARSVTGGFSVRKGIHRDFEIAELPDVPNGDSPDGECLAPKQL